MAKIEALLEVMAQLRDPVRGCPWDKEQDFESLLPHTLEEAFEVADAVASKVDDALCEELGDLLFQVVFYARIAEEQQRFNFNDVVEAIVTKLIRRHPHVFADACIDTAAEQALAWEQHKRRERNEMDVVNEFSVMDGVTAGLPALTRAVKLQRRAAQIGFDWPDIGGVLAKIEEEIAEVRHELATGADPERMQHEVGDVLLAASNLARHAGVDPELAVHRANKRFEQRFRQVETMCRQQGGDAEPCSLARLEEYWQLAKQNEV